MEEQHYRIVTNTYSDGTSVSRLEPVEDMSEEFCDPLTPYNQEETKYSRYFRDIEAVKDDLLHGFLIEQFEDFNLHLRRFASPDGSVQQFYIEDMITGDQLYETATWDGVMDAYMQYIREDRFRMVRDSEHDFER